MSRMERKQAQSIGDALKDFMKAYHLTPRINTRRIFEAWYQASGAACFTTRLFFREGTLHVTLSSSAARSQLQFQSAAILDRMNALLGDDPLFDGTDPVAGYVKQLKLK